MPVRATWKGVIKLSLITIPIRVFPATNPGSDVSFRQLHRKCKTPIQMKKWCPHCDEEVSSEFKRMLAEHSALGSANTQLGVQGERPSLYELIEDMKKLSVPTLIITGDEDWPCLLPGVLMKQNIASSALAVMPNAGHTINIEDPDEFNRIVGNFLAQVESGRWPSRDPRAVTASITGMKT
jgi:pimeloyl-ACP methyl ester carboxylesterase